MKNFRQSEIMKKRWENNRSDLIKICQLGGKSKHIHFKWSEAALKNHKGALGKHWKVKNTNSLARIKACKLGGKAACEQRKKNGTYKWSSDAKGRKSLKYFGRKPWSTGLTKQTDERLKRISLNKTIHFNTLERQGFTKEIKLTIGARDNFVCQECGEIKDLVIHHIDMNPMNNSLNNLILMCRKCHSRLHLNFQYKKYSIFAVVKA